MHRQQILLLKEQKKKPQQKPNQPNKNPNQNPHTPVLKQMRISLGMEKQGGIDKGICNFLEDLKKPHSYRKNLSRQEYLATLKQKSCTLWFRFTEDNDRFQVWKFEPEEKSQDSK